jgi:hypothetical protein
MFDFTANTAKSLRKILKFARAKKLGAQGNNGCIYHTPRRAKFCAIGCLLTKAEHDRLDDKGLNVDYGANALLCRNDFPDLDTRLGLTDDTADILQCAHDTAYRDLDAPKKEFITGIRLCLKNQSIQRAHFPYLT